MVCNKENIMRATDVIRNILDVIDNIDNSEVVPSENVKAVNTDVSDHGDDVNRFKQVMDLLQNEYKMYDNSPCEVVASIDSVTKNAGGGWNGPKNPADMRADSVPLYPHYQHKPE